MVVVRDEEQETVRLEIETCPGGSRGGHRACGIQVATSSRRAARIPYSVFYSRFMLFFGRAFECFALS